MKLRREIDQDLKNWLKTDKALLVFGPRQTGKTYSVSHFIEENFKNPIEINCLNNLSFKEMLRNVRSSDDFVTVISAISNKELIPGETCIFIDEIQEIPEFDFITFSKFLSSEYGFRFAFSGSLLGIEIKNMRSYPVGYVVQLEMHPLDFQEFLWAYGKDDKLYSYLKDCFSKRKPVNPGIHEVLMDLFYKYLVIGGMPEVVSTFLDSKDISFTNQIKKYITNSLKIDVLKYVKIEDRPYLGDVYDLIPEELKLKNKRFSYTRISKSHNQVTKTKITNDFVWLKKAGIAIPVYNTFSPEAPLLINTDRNVMKLFHMDVGILGTMMEDPSLQEKLFRREKQINNGALFENFVAQELNSHGFDHIFYFDSKKVGEIDFLIEYEGEVVPIEVKSGKDFMNHKALDNVLSSKEYRIKEAFVFHDGNVEVEGGITYLPIYMIDLFRKQG